jgi:hypothetical protein
MAEGRECDRPTTKGLRTDDGAYAQLLTAGMTS